MLLVASPRPAANQRAEVAAVHKVGQCLLLIRGRPRQALSRSWVEMIDSIVRIAAWRALASQRSIVVVSPVSVLFARGQRGLEAGTSRSRAAVGSRSGEDRAAFRSRRQPSAHWPRRSCAAAPRRDDGTGHCAAIRWRRIAVSQVRRPSAYLPCRSLAAWSPSMSIRTSCSAKAGRTFR